MPTYTFTVELRGSGLTEEEAWQDAIDSFASDPGEPCEVEQDDDDFTDIPDDETDTFDFDQS
jgi:hypothetical protein